MDLLKKYHENVMNWIHINNLYFTKARRSKKIWVPKVKNLSNDSDVLYKSDLK